VIVAEDYGMAILVDEYTTDRTGCDITVANAVTGLDGADFVLESGLFGDSSDFDDVGWDSIDFFWD
jgi:hypothetical protein